MALKKIVSYKGMNCEYWKILTILEAFINNKQTITLGLYKDKEARDDNPANYLDIKIIGLDGSDKTRTQVYTALKLLPDFLGAEDC